MLLDTYYGANVGLKLCGTQKEVESTIFTHKIIQSRLGDKNQHLKISNKESGREVLLYSLEKYAF